MKHSGNRKVICTAAVAALGFAVVCAAEDLKPLGDYPQVDRIWMGMEEGSIRPAAYAQQRSMAEGLLLLHAKDGQMLKEGECWATVDPEQLAIETKALALDERKLEQQRRKLAMDALDAESQLTLQLSEMMDDRSALLEASKNSQVPARLRQQAAEAVAKLESQIALQKQRLEPANLKAELQLELDAAELAIVRKRKQIDVLGRRSKMVAEFAGALKLSDRVKDALEKAGEPKVWVEANQLLATLKDDSRYEITVAAASPVLGSIPRDKLMVFLQQPRTGKLIEGVYARTEELDTGVEIRTHYIFSIPKAGLQDALNSVGQLNLVHVYRKFSKPYRLVHKKDIAFAAPEVLSASGWSGLVRHLWPGSQVVQVGPQAIAVQAKDED